MPTPEIVARTRTVTESGVWVTIAPCDFDTCVCANHNHDFKGAPRDENKNLVSYACMLCYCPTHITDRKARHRGSAVFLTIDLLEEVDQQGVWDSQFGRVLLVDSLEGCALVQLGWAVEETRGGYHGTDELKAWLKARTY